MEQVTVDREYLIRLEATIAVIMTQLEKASGVPMNTNSPMSSLVLHAFAACELLGEDEPQTSHEERQAWHHGPIHDQMQKITDEGRFTIDLPPGHMN